MTSNKRPSHIAARMLNALHADRYIARNFADELFRLGSLIDAMERNAAAPPAEAPGEVTLVDDVVERLMGGLLSKQVNRDDLIVALLQSRPLLAAAPAAPAEVPADVMAALDRMCTPLDPSWIKGATMKRDAECMAIIRDYILSAPRVTGGRDVERIHIAKPEKLDPITVYLEDYGNGQGRAVIVCYSSAWTCYWGSMGRPLREFIAGCDEGYVGGCMTSMSHGRVTSSAQEYADRVARAVIDHIALQTATGRGDA